MNISFPALFRNIFSDRAISALASGGALMLLGGLPAQAATYYVSPAGLDTNAGTLAAPWKTLQKAATTMVAGDTTYVRAGTYRESVTPAHSGTAASPITFEGYGSEVAIVSGLDVVNTPWTLSSGNIYSTPFTMSQGDQNQLFIDGNMGNLARWPNDTDGDLFTHDGAVVTSGNTGSITCSTLPAQATDFYKGAVVWFSADDKWTSMGWTISSSSGTTINFSNGASATFKTAHNPGVVAGTDHNYFYISGLLGLLDTEKEWYYDSALGKLYLWVTGGGSPASHTVEVKARTLAFNLSQSYIHLNKLQIKGAKVTIAGSNNVLDGITGTYMFHHDARGMEWSYTVPLLWPNTGAFIITGANNTIKNSDLSYSAASMIIVGSGSDNTTIDNNYIHHVDYNGSYDAGIIADGTLGSATITRNTMYTSGRSLIHIGGPVLTKPWDIKWNDFSNSMIFTDDGAAFYTNGSDLQGTVLAYNHFHGQVAMNAHLYSPGFYLDDKCKNITVHHDVVYDIPTGQSATVKIGEGMTGKNVYNITTYNVPSTFIAYHSAGTSVNVNNLVGAASGNFVNAASHDFRPVGTATAIIDKGATGPPWTDGYAGNSPDLGAYEYGGPARLSSWTVGVGSTIYADVTEPAPPPLPEGVIDDTTTGSGTNQWEYAGTWELRQSSGCTLDTNHFCTSSAGGTAKIRFTGGRIRLYAWRYGTPQAAGISIDGGSETMVNYNGTGNNDIAMVYDSGNLTVGSHILTVRAPSSGISVDKAEISPVNDIIVDNTAATFTGSWTTVGTPTRPGFFGNDYKTDGNAGKGTKTAKFTPAIPSTGTYEVYGRWIADPNKSGAVPYTITHAGTSTPVTVDQRFGGGAWTLIGTYTFNAGTTDNVVISNTGTTGTVVADAVRLVAAGSSPPPLPTVNVNATIPNASETGTAAGVFTFSRDTTAGNLTVYYNTPTGTAVLGTDYTVSPAVGSVVIPDGQPSATVTVTPIDDATVESTENVQLTLSPNANYLVGTDTASINIADNDQSSPIVNVTSNTDPDASETGSDPGIFTISRSTGTGNLTVYYTMGGTAAEGTDYSIAPSGGSVVMLDGELSKAVTITPVDDTVPNEGNETAQLTVTANAAYTIGTGSAVVTIADNDESSIWTNQDIGSPSIAGSTTYDSGTGVFTVKGSGLGFSGTSDSFQFAYQSLTGDGQLIARVNSITSTNAWARGGVMIRETLAVDAKFACMYVTKSANTVTFQRRTTIGGTPVGTTWTGAPPMWLKVVRAGNTFTGFRSADGITWSTVASQTITMSSTVYVGMVGSSCVNTSLGTFLIDSVQ